MGQELLNQLVHVIGSMGATFTLLCSWIAGLPFPVWCAAMIIAVLYVIEK